MCTGCHKSPHSHGVPNLHILQRVPLFLSLLPSFSVFSRSLLRYRAQRPPLSFSSAPSFATRRFASTRRASEFSSLARWRRTSKAVHRGRIAKTRGYRRGGPFRRVNRFIVDGRRKKASAPQWCVNLYHRSFDLDLTCATNSLISRSERFHASNRLSVSLHPVFVDALLAGVN